MRRAAEVKRTVTAYRERLAERMGEVPPGYWMIGLSGGADSVLLLVLMTEEQKAGCRFGAIHVNHGLRGAESDADEAFVRELCSERKVPLYVFRPDLKGRTDENTAREARYACFRRCAEENGADGVLLAHHADDLAETFLMRLLRGAGTEGLGCMRASDERDGLRILRPMLRLRREEIRQALAEAEIPWREDRSNQDTRYLRNAVRQKLIPLMEDLAPGAANRLAEAAGVIAEDNRVLDAEAEAFLKEHAFGSHLDAESLRQAPKGLQARILRRWWRENAPIPEEHALSYGQTEALTGLVRLEKGTVNLPAGMTAVRGKRMIHLSGPKGRNGEEKPYRREPVSIGGLTLETGPGEGDPGNGKTVQEMPEGFADGCVLRFRRPGDRIRPFGMAGSRKLQDYLTDRGIEAPWRDEIPLLCRGDEVIWAAGVGAGAVPRQTDGEKQVRLRWSGPMPWMNED